MNKKLIMCPESYPVVKRLLDFLLKTEGEGFDLLLLTKQRDSLDPLIEAYKFGFGEIYYLDEDYYGRVTNEATEKFIAEKLKHPYDVVYFPLNTFRANAFLFGSVLGRLVRAVSASLYGKLPDKDVPIDSFTLRAKNDLLTTLPWAHIMKEVRWTYGNIVNTLKLESANFEATGERPGLGIMEGFAHDLETFCKYALASTYVKNKRVLDIGGGIGYGSYLLSRFAEKVYFLDQSQEALDFVDRVWLPLSSNIVPALADSNQGGGVGGPGIEEDSFDVVVLMDVIEHVKEPMAVLESVKYLLKDEGRLIITTPEEDFYPYSVCPQERWGEPEAELLKDAIWPWHIQALGEEKLLPLLEDMGYEVLKKSYTTYKSGYKYKEMLRRAVESSDLLLVKETLNELTAWEVSDFELTEARDPYFSAASYNIVARKSL